MDKVRKVQERQEVDRLANKIREADQFVEKQRSVSIMVCVVITIYSPNNDYKN